MITNAYNKFVNLHIKDGNCYNVNEINTAVIPNVKPNECGAFTNKALFILLDSKTDFVIAEVACQNEKFYAGYDYGYENGGGCSGPSIHGKGFLSAKEALLHIINMPFLNKRYPDLSKRAREITAKQIVQLEIDW